MQTMSDAGVYYLPIYVPLLLTILAIVSRIPQEGLSWGALSKTHTEVLHGVMAFCVWALISFFQTGHVALNSDLEIPFAKIILFMLLVVILLMASTGMGSYRWRDSAGGQIRTAQDKALVWNTGMFFVAFGLFALPALLATPIPKSPPKPTSGRYAVAVPYDDPSIPKHVGPNRWAGRRLCEVADLEARDIRSAKAEAVKRFRESGRAFEVFGRAGPQASVQVREDLLTAELR